MATVVQASQVCKSYGSQSVLQNFDFHLQEGNIYTLLGASGSGKTTLLSLIVGLIRAEKGRILVFETAAARNREEAIHESAVATGLRAEAWGTNERLAANMALVLGHGQQEAEINAEMRAQACDIIDRQNAEVQAGMQQHQALLLVWTTSLFRWKRAK